MNVIAAEATQAADQEGFTPMPWCFSAPPATSLTKRIFPALQALTRRGRLEVPVVGVAKSGWTLPQLIERARSSVTEHGGLDEAAFAKLAARLRYIDGDYRLRHVRAGTRRAPRRPAPAALSGRPPSMFPIVIEHLQQAGLSEHGRVVVEKPFGRNLALGALAQ